MKRFRYAYLLSSLVLVAFVRPFISESTAGISVLDLVFFATLLAGVYAAVDQSKSFVAICSLGVVSVAAQLTFFASRSPIASAAFLIAGLAFYLTVTWAILRTLFAYQGKVTRDTLYQAFSVYLLIGLVGAMAYALLEFASPGSFTFAKPQARTNAQFDRFLGFSYTTLTTLGYGNIAPANPRADALSTLQAVTGQIYLAVVIARLVGIEVGQRAAHQSRQSTDRN